MMKRIGLTTSYWLPTLALLALTSVAPSRMQSQSSIPRDQDSDLTRQQLGTFDQFLDNHPDLARELRNTPSLVNNEEFVENHPDLQQYLQQHPEVRQELNQNPNAAMHQEQRYDRREDQQRDQDRDRDATRGELANLDRFMDSHPEIADQLRKNPSLIDNKEFVESHPAFKQFLAEHPGVREQYRENPNGFMQQEQRFDRREDSGLRGDSDVNRRELSNMNRFMEHHPEIAEQLRKNPSLVDNKEFVENHPALKTFLAEHQSVAEELRENPNGFMAQEQRFDQREDSGWRGDSDVNRRELSNMDRFMEHHPEMAEQLRKNPSLVDNKEFVENHPALKTFLAEHQSLAQELRENPSGFMAQEQRFDRRENAGLDRDSDLTRGNISSFHDFLEHHNNIASELTKNPSLATNEEYLENHSELQTYLKANPQVQEELRENPQAFVKSTQAFDTTPKNTAKAPTAEPKLK